MFKLLLSKALKKLNIPSVQNSQLGKSTYIGAHSNIYNAEIGDYSYCGYYCNLNHAKIGKFCSIANGVVIGGASHPLHFVSTSPAFLKNNGAKCAGSLGNLEFKNFENTVIGSDVWIGENAIIKSGVEIGHGAVIGMGAVVTKSVAPYSIVAGNPARHIRYRFDESTRETLLQLEWWNLSAEKLSSVAQYMNDPVAFMSKEALL